MNMKEVMQMEETLRNESTWGNKWDRAAPDEVWHDLTPNKDPDTRQVSGSHYVEMKLQPWTVIKALLTVDEWRGFLKGNVIKYAMRQGRKAGSDDAGKAEHYLDKLRQEGF